MKTNIVIALCASFLLFVAACKKKEEGAAATDKPAATTPADPKTTEKPAETKPAAPAGGGAIASSADYESKAMAAMEKMTAIFATGGKDCDKIAADITKFAEENKPFLESSKAWEKDHPDDKKAFNTKAEAKMKDFMAKAGPAMEACKDHKGLADAMSKMGD